MYYSEHLPNIIEIIDTIENDNIMIRNAKDALSNLNVFHSIFQIKTSYQSLIDVQWQIYHRAGLLLPPPDADHKCLQNYFMGNTD